MASSLLYHLLVLIYCTVNAECCNNDTSRTTRENHKCVLPPQPEHGKWEILGGCANPGEEVATNTLIKFTCDAHYKLTINLGNNKDREERAVEVSPYVVCDENWNVNRMPTCDKLCPPIFSTATTTISCKNKGSKVACHEATDGTLLSFACAPYYEAPFGYKRAIYCIEGEWKSSIPQCQPICGKRVNDDVIPIIAGGQLVKTIQFPWVIALYRKDSKNFNYTCGGSMLNMRVILTAAHCVTDDYGNSLPAKEFHVAGGKLYSPYRDSRDTKAQYLEVQRVIVNSEYKGESRRFLGDVALLITKKMFMLSPLVQPICFNGVNEISLQVGNVGEIASWGTTEEDVISDELRFLSIPYKYDDVCEKELPPEWSEKYNILDKMCAGIRNQSKSVCKGDSGSALAFKNREDNRYYVHGVASLAPVTAGRKCNIQQNALYTKVSFYYEFIDRWLTIYQEDNCLLPPYPKNGQYFVKNHPGKGPGDVAFSTDILRIQCNSGYILNGTKSKITCEAAINMPNCQYAPTVTTAPDIVPSIDIKVICTYGSWSWYENVSPDQLNVNLCTHFYYAYVGLSDTGELLINDPYADIERGLYKKFTGLKKKKSDLKVVLSVGGSRTNNTLFSGTAKSDNKTEAFIESAKKFMTTYGFDGINIHWNNPSKADKDDYITFLSNIKNAFKEKGWLVTASTDEHGWVPLEESGYSPKKMNDILDFVILKTYDYYGFWSQHTGEHTGLYPAFVEDQWERDRLNVDATVKDWLDAGLKKDKLVMSVAFYGRTFKLKDEGEHGLHADTVAGEFDKEIVKYSEFCKHYNNSIWNGVWNDEQKSTYYYKDKTWFSIDTKDAMWIKGAYVKDNELFGVNVWFVDNDDVFGKCGTKFELLKHLHGGMGHQVIWNE